MTQEDKRLLLKDLCNRIMYGVKCAVYENTDVHTLSGVLPNKVYNELYFEELDWKECNGFADIQYCKPYLFPLSNMTKEQRYELHDLIHNLNVLAINGEIGDWIVSSSEIDWYNKNHFDYKGLIEKGLALDATGLNIY